MRHLIQWIVMAAAALSGYTKEAKPTGKATQMDSFTTYYVESNFHNENFEHGVLCVKNIAFPATCEDQFVLKAIQKDLIRIVTDTNLTDMRTALQADSYFGYDSLYTFSGTKKLHIIDHDSLYNHGGHNNWYDVKYLTTTYNSNGIYACQYEYNLYDGRAHNSYGSTYAMYNMATGKKIRLEDIFSNYQCEQLYNYVFNEYEVDGDFRKNIRTDYSLGFKNSSLVVHYNPYVTGSFADGEREVVIPINVDSLIKYIKIEHRYSEYLDSILPKPLGFEWYYKDNIRRVARALATRDKKALAKMIMYPMWEPYPIKNIENEQEFIQNFDCLVTKDISEKVDTTSLFGWERVGWRGIMYDNGMIWLGDYGDQIRSISYTTPEETALYERLCAEERRLIGFPEKERPSQCYLAPDSAFLIHITYLPSDEYGGDYRVRLYRRGDPLDKPYLNEPCEQFYGGSCGNLDLSASNESLNLLVWNSDCGFRVFGEFTYGCQFNVPNGSNSRNFQGYKYGETYSIIPCYLRDIAKWW